MLSYNAGWADGKSQLIGKAPADGKDWGWEEKGAAEDDVVGWHHWLSGREFEQTPVEGEGQGSLVCAVHGVTESRTWLGSWTTTRGLGLWHAAQAVTFHLANSVQRAVQSFNLASPWPFLLFPGSFFVSPRWSPTILSHLGVLVANPRFVSWVLRVWASPKAPFCRGGGRHLAVGSLDSFWFFRPELLENKGAYLVNSNVLLCGQPHLHQSKFSIFLFILPKTPRHSVSGDGGRQKQGREVS